ncbi:MAG: MFS transporter [Pseudomonadota bacterium]
MERQTKLSPFAIPAYRRLFTAHTTALLGSGISTIAIALLAIEVASDNATQVLGIAFAIKMICYVLIAPFTSRLNTFFVPKTLLVVLDVIRALVLISMVWISTQWQIYLAIAVISAASALFTPTYQALLPSVVENEKAYIKALSWAQVASAIEQIGSPLAAAALLIVLSFSDLFFLNTATFLLSAMLISTTALPLVKKTNSTSSTWWGISAYLKTPRLRAISIAYIGIAGASAMVIVNTAVYVQQTLGESESVMSIVLAASGLGAVAGALLVPTLKLMPRNIFVFGNFTMALAIFGGSAELNWLGLSFSWLIVGFGLGLTQTPVGAVVRQSCHPRHRDAFFAANFTLSHAAWLFTYLLAGFLGAQSNWQNTFLIMGSLPLLAGMACLFLYPHPDEIILEHQHGEVTHRHEFFIDESHTHWPK